MRKQFVEFVSASDLIHPLDVKMGFWGVFSSDAPFSWGDNNRTLITASRFLEHLLDSFVTPSAGTIRRKRWDILVEKLEKLGETYIDLES